MAKDTTKAEAKPEDVSTLERIKALEAEKAALQDENAALRQQAESSGDGIGRSGKFFRDTQSTKARQWDFMVWVTAGPRVNGADVWKTFPGANPNPRKFPEPKGPIIKACDESEAIRLYTLTHCVGGDGKFCGTLDDLRAQGREDDAKPMNTPDYNIVAECVDPLREKLRVARYVRAGYGMPGEKDKRTIPGYEREEVSDEELLKELETAGV